MSLEILFIFTLNIDNSICYNFKLHCFVGHGMIILISDSNFHKPLNSSFCQYDIEGEKRMAGEVLDL